MGTIHELIKQIEGQLISMERDTVNGWYFLKIGIPNGWVFKGNAAIDCEVFKKLESGQILKIIPKYETITIDDLVAFVLLVIQTNGRIVEKEEEFVSRIKMVRDELEAEKEIFYDELNELKEKTFTAFDSDVKVPPPPPPPPPRLYNEDGAPIKKRGRGRPPGAKNKRKSSNVGEGTE